MTLNVSGIGERELPEVGVSGKDILTGSLEIFTRETSENPSPLGKAYILKTDSPEN